MKDFTKASGVIEDSVRLRLFLQASTCQGVGMESTVRQLEESLRVAMLASDVAALDSLIADTLIFVGPSGDIFRKEDDLDLHRSGRQKLMVAEWRSVEIVPHGRSAVALVTANLAGTFDGNAFSGDFRYCRFWAETDAGWRVVGGSVLVLGSAA